MAKKISQLTQATEVKSDDVTVIVQDGETKKLPLNMMVTKQDIENKKIVGLAKLDEIEATYENDTYTPTITVKNKSSVKVGEGDGVDYSANVMDGHVKSAILRGNTLVNMCDDGVADASDIDRFTHNYTGNGGTFEKVSDGIKVTATVGDTFLIVGYDIRSQQKQTMAIGKKYYGVADVTVHKLTNSDSCEVIFRSHYGLRGSTSLTNGRGLVQSVFTHSSVDSNYGWLAVGTNSQKAVVGDSFTIHSMSVYEITEEEVNLSYEELANKYPVKCVGMQSVKMPVLKVTGKNLFNPLNFKNGELVEINGEKFFKYVDGAKPFEFTTDFETNKQYTITFSAKRDTGDETKDIYLYVYYTDGSRDYRIINGSGVDVGTITTSVNKTISKICGSNGFSKNVYINLNVSQLEEGSIATSYEPYKSNILTTPSDLELRGIGEVKDELDLMTGEVTERIKELVIDGSSNLSYYLNGVQPNDDTLARFNIITTNDIKSGPNNTLMCDKLPYFYIHGLSGGANVIDQECISNHSASNNTFNLIIKKERLSKVSVDGLKQWLQTNPFTLQYQLTTESIKTVDLMPSGTHSSTTPYCWKNGHIQLSSSGLLPNLEYSVVTSRAGQINQNATMIVKNDKRIFDLEILLAGGLVNTTYQALTLQNQVETGLSKVSLNSETEPDYLLYHMIMKLIEEKAYKLDDLTEKVSVFYLYEKLSDTQFETIYSALYPFVEDEIVEEPVVEELPEEVEDEVIM